MLLAIVQALLVGLLFAGTGIAGKLVAGYGISPFVTSFCRFVCTALFLVPFLKWHEFKNMNKKFAGYFFLLALTGIFLFNVLFFSALQYTSAVTVNIIAAVNPMLALLATAALTRTIPSRQQLYALVLAFIGISIIVIQHSTPTAACADTAGLGQFLALAAVLSQVAYAMLIKKMGKHFSPVFLSFTISVIGLFLLAPFAYDGIPTLMANLTNSNVWLSLLYAGTIGGALPATLYIHTIKTFGAPTGNLIVFTASPVFTAILSILFLGVAPTYWHLAGGCFVITALFLGLRHGRTA